MLKTIIYGLNKIANLFHKTARLLEKAPHQNIHTIQVKQWFNDHGDETHRLNYDLTENSMVFDLGGYEGQWASDLFSKYCCNTYIFEPFTPFSEKIALRFKMNPKIKVYGYGLSNINTITKLTVSANTSSIYKTGPETADIQLIRADDFLKANDIQYIDLIKINIEGGEYDLLEHLIEKKLIKKFGNIQIQFHDFVPDAESRMHKIQQMLALTHKLTYQYIFVWENWSLKNDNS
jgi:FkbM family methyltransferase